MFLQLTDGTSFWTDKQKNQKPIILEDVLVVAPFNAQVSALTAALPTGARVGTVDKFQGQEAPIVIYSMTSSSVDDAPREMSFLFSRNRMNVATSRARCLVLLVGSSDLFKPDCSSPEQIRLANGLCRFPRYSPTFSLATPPPSPFPSVLLRACKKRATATWDSSRKPWRDRYSIPRSGFGPLNKLRPIR